MTAEEYPAALLLLVGKGLDLTAAGLADLLAEGNAEVEAAVLSMIDLMGTWGLWKVDDEGVLHVTPCGKRAIGAVEERGHEQAHRYLAPCPRR